MRGWSYQNKSTNGWRHAHAELMMKISIGMIRAYYSPVVPWPSRFRVFSLQRSWTYVIMLNYESLGRLLYTVGCVTNMTVFRTTCTCVCVYGGAHWNAGHVGNYDWLSLSPRSGRNDRSFVGQKGSRTTWQPRLSASLRRVSEKLGECRTARWNFPGRLTVVLNRARQSDTGARIYPPWNPVLSSGLVISKN